MSAVPSHSPDAESAVMSVPFSALLQTPSRRSATYERELKDLEEKLLEDLSNCRAIEGIIRDSFTSIKRKYRRADQDTLRMSVPQIDDELAESLRVLAELESRLPVIHTQVAQAQLIYDSGRRKAEELVHDLRWLNRDWHARWYEVIFRSRSPVSWQWRVTLRGLFASIFVMASWMAWIALSAVLRAHQQRLVWGERLPS
ncbi:hypothetical protein BC834DRAFT_974888 [Gloeopeniophorella convolvens]|nr:hypothetical protein BC834DRAFT_974888 [Gloeopeniophorella convolvens]